MKEQRTMMKEQRTKNEGLGLAAGDYGTPGLLRAQGLVI
jgi:hypothetical protein